MDATTLPVVGLLPTPRQPGVKSAEDTTTPHLIPYRFHDAFRTDWSCDGHFVCYSAVGRSTWPRYTKPALMSLRQHGIDVQMNLFGFDYDNPGHAQWTPIEQARFLDRLQLAADQLSLIWDWSVFYFTRGGARLVYVLDQPLPVDQAEAKHRWLVQALTALGIVLDPACSDWTRLFRLPRVMRDGQPTWAQSYFDMLEQDRTLSVEALGEMEKPRTFHYAAIREVTEPKPDPNDALAKVWRQASNGRTVLTNWGSEAKKRLKNRKLFACLFEDELLAVPGQRDETLHSYVGEAIAVLFDLEATTPSHIFGLFLNAVLRFEPDSRGEWDDILWDKIKRIWANEDAKHRYEEAKATEEAEQALALSDRVVQGMSQWCPHEVFSHGSTADKLEYATRRLIVSCGNNYWLMQPNGWYGRQTLSRSQIIPAIRIGGMEGLIETRELRNDGAFRDIDPQTLLNRYSTNVERIEATPNIDGGFIEDIDSGYARFVWPCYALNDRLEPQYNSDVDQWLHLLFGDDYYQIACEWIGWALQFGDPICALSLVGPKGIGKKMLVRGLAECLRDPVLADVNDLTSDYQYGLLESPFLVVNEGWKPGYRGIEPSALVRILIGGDGISCNRKMLQPVRLKCPTRILFTANNLDVVRLLGGENLDPDDRAALAERLLHVRCDMAAADWLRRMGGMRFTARPGARWIAGDGGRSPSDFILAKHFLYLHQTKADTKCPRFLVEGQLSGELMDALTTESGTMPFIIETVLRMLNGMHQMKRPGLTVEEGRLFVLTSEIIDYYRHNMQQSVKERLTTTIVNKNLKSLVVSESRQPVVLPSRRDMGRRHWKELDCELLHRVAERDGWKCPLLDQILAEQHARAAGTYVEPAENPYEPPGVTARTAGFNNRFRLGQQLN